MFLAFPTGKSDVSAMDVCTDIMSSCAEGKEESPDNQSVSSLSKCGDNLSLLSKLYIDIPNEGLYAA